MSLLPFAQWLAGTPGSIALHESLFMYPLIESVHVLTLCVFVGMSVMLDLRLLGLALKRVPVTDMTRRLLPWMLAGFVVMVITGVLLVYAIPVRSYQSIWFRMKVILVAVGCLMVAEITTTIASNPATSNVAVPSTVGQKVVINWTGSIPPLANGTSDCSKLADTPDREISTTQIGELLMERLRSLDKIAYVRFASVYRDFQDVDAFLAELTDLLQRRTP